MNQQPSRFMRKIEKYKITFPNNGDGLKGTNEDHYLLPPSIIAMMYRKGYVKKDYAFNRHQVWSEEDKNKWAAGTAGGYNITPFYLIDIESSLQAAIENNDDYNVTYFQRLIDEDYEFITCVGGNRGEATQELYEDGRITDDDNQHIHVIIKQNSTLEHAHSVYGYEAAGVQPNRQEIRNGKWGHAAKLVRDIANKWRNIVFVHFKKDAFNSIRMLDDRQVAGWVYFASVCIPQNKNVLTVIKEDNLDDMYEDGSIINDSAVKRASDFTVKWFETFAHIKETSIHRVNQLGKSHLFSVAALYYVLEKNKLEINDWKAAVKWYFDWINEGILSSEILYKKEKNLMMKELLAGSSFPNQVKFLLNYISKKAVNTMKKNGLVVELRSNFSKDDKQQWWNRMATEGPDGLKIVPIRQNGSTLEKGSYHDSLDEFKYVGIDEFMNDSNIEEDHVVPLKPHNKKMAGGRTDLYNLEYTTKGYNKWKYNYTPNYSAPLSEG